MEKFQGWTPVTIDNLTFDQLNAIFKELNDRQERKKDDKIETSLKNVSSVKMTEEQKKAWISAGYPSPVEKFLKEYKKK